MQPGSVQVSVEAWAWGSAVELWAWPEQVNRSVESKSPRMVGVSAMAEGDEFGVSTQTPEGESGKDFPTSEDLQTLAEKVFALIKEDLRVERERLGYLERRGGRGGV